MKFLHTADIHLDSPLRGMRATAESPVDRLRQSTRRAFENLVGYALDEAVDFIVIAGDLYDGTWRDYATGLYFAKQMARLAEAGIPVYIVLGNHDAESRLTHQLRLPDNVHVFSSARAETFLLADRGVALHGRSFPTAAVHENLVLGYPPAVPNCVNIGLLHTAAGGREAHANYAPCALPDLLAKGYDYWALGHVHAREVLHEHPHVVFPGNLQGRHIRETGPKGFTLVRVEGRRIAAADAIVADVVRWLRWRVDLAAADNFNDAIDAVDAALVAAHAAAEDRFAVIRLVFEGATPAHDRLAMQRDRLLAECQAAAARVSPDLWIEKVELASRPRHDRDAVAARPDALGELIRSVDELASDGEARHALAEELYELVTRLPDELKPAWVAPDNAGPRIKAERLDALIADAQRLLARRILDTEGEA